MNKVILMGRLTTNPEVRYSQGEKSTCIARYTLAVDRRIKKDGEEKADFIRCVCFGKPAEHAEKYYHRGIRVVVSGRIQTGSYTNKEGQKVYTTEVVVEEQEFSESKKADSQPNQAANQAAQQPNPEAPQPNYQQAPQPDYQQAPQPNYQQAPQPDYQQAPQPNYQQAPQANYQAAPQGSYQMPTQQSAPTYQQPQSSSAPQQAYHDGFMNIPDTLDDDLPFN